MLYNVDMFNKERKMTMFYDSAKSREYTCKLLEAVEEGLLDPEAALRACLCYMSEGDVEDMIRVNSLLDLGDEDEDEVDEEEEDYIFEGGHSDEAIDPMEDFNYVGSRYHY
jgi:hypothetical protein